MNEQPREKPILFSAPMVRAILEGRKTMTRRVVHAQHPDGSIETNCIFRRGDQRIHPPCWIGDTLWVREAWGIFDGGTMFGEVGEPTLFDQEYAIAYKADDDPTNDLIGGVTWFTRPKGEKQLAVDEKWRSPLFMPRWASRINLRVLDVRPERLKDISEEDAKAEGVERHPLVRDINGEHFPDAYRMAFLALWDSIHAKHTERTWAANPWVWRIAFEGMEPFR